MSWESRGKVAGARQQVAGKYTLKAWSRFHDGDLPISLDVGPRCLSVRLSTQSGHSQIRRCVVLHQNSYGRFRLETADQVIELRQAATDPNRTFE